MRIALKPFWNIRNASKLLSALLTFRAPHMPVLLERGILDNKTWYTLCALEHVACITVYTAKFIPLGKSMASVKDFGFDKQTTCFVEH